MDVGATMTEALEPVRTALLVAARQHAERAEQQAITAEAELLGAAVAQADGVRRRAREQGATDAAAALSAGRTRARREARAEVLGVRRESYESLRAAALAAVGELRDDPGYPRARERMIDLVHRLLGPAAEVREGVAGGIIGTVPNRRLDLSLAGYAARAVDAVAAEAAGSEVERP
jgi:vacuolar-type H+-ATPase subunit E/Vma4